MLITEDYIIKRTILGVSSDQAPGSGIVSCMGRLSTLQVETARRFASAEQYAEAMNPYGTCVSTDPPPIKDRIEQEHERLKALWNFWKELGLVGTAVLEFG